MIHQHDKERLDFLRKVESFREGQSFALWKELSHFRFAYFLFSSNHLELKKLLKEHDVQDLRFFHQMDMMRRSRLQKRIAQALFNFLSAAYSLRENIKEVRNQIFIGQKDAYFNSPILVCGHELRNFFIHRATPSSHSGSKSNEREKAAASGVQILFYIKKEAFQEYLNQLENEKNKNRIANAKLAKAYLANCPNELIISNFAPVYFDAVTEYYLMFLFNFEKNKKLEIVDLQHEMNDLCSIAEQLGGLDRWLPFPVSTPRYLRLLMRRI